MPAGFDGFDRGKWPRVHYVTLTQYDEKYACPHAFPPQTLDKILGQVVSEAGKRQLLESAPGREWDFGAERATAYATRSRG